LFLFLVYKHQDRCGNLIKLLLYNFSELHRRKVRAKLTSRTRTSSWQGHGVSTY